MWAKYTFSEPHDRISFLQLSVKPDLSHPESILLSQTLLELSINVKVPPSLFVLDNLHC